MKICISVCSASNPQNKVFHQSLVLTMACQHHLCLDCASNKLQKQTITCQICLQQTQLSPKAVDFLSDKKQNILVQQLKESSHSLKKSIRSVLEKQTKKHHQQESVLKGSNKLFCFTCFNQCFSIQEFLKGGHLKHKVQDLKQALPKLKQHIQLSLQTLIFKENIFGVKISEIQHKINELKENQEQLHQLVEKSFINLFRIIKNQQQQCQSQVTQRTHKLISGLQLQKVNIENVRNQIFIYISKLKQIIKDPYEKQQMFDYVSTNKTRINQLSKFNKDPLTNNKIEKIKFQCNPAMLQKCIEEFALVLPKYQVQKTNKSQQTCDSFSICSSSARFSWRHPVDVSFRLRQKMIIDSDIYSVGYHSPRAKIKELNFKRFR